VCVCGGGGGGSSARALIGTGGARIWPWPCPGPGREPDCSPHTASATRARRQAAALKLRGERAALRDLVEGARARVAAGLAPTQVRRRRRAGCAVGPLAKPPSARPSQRAPFTLARVDTPAPAQDSEGEWARQQREAATLAALRRRREEVRPRRCARAALAAAEGLIRVTRPTARPRPTPPPRRGRPLLRAPGQEAACLDAKGAATESAAEPRPNAYVPDDICIPRPFGAFAPFKPAPPSAAAARAARPPAPRAVVI
jgi:hypothetical protein